MNGQLATKHRRAGLESQNKKQQRALRGLSRRDQQRKSLLNNLTSGSFHSFGNEIINNLNEPDIVVGMLDSGKPNAGVIAGDDENESARSGVEFDSTSKSHDGSATTITSASGRKMVQKTGSMAVLQKKKKLVSARHKQPRVKMKSAFDIKMASAFGDTVLWNNPNDFVANKVTAFSETSLANSHHQGYIDEEGHGILRRLQKDKDKLDVYGRSQPQIMLKNVGMCTGIEFPSSDMNNAELSFGKQQHMYKNANSVISERTKMSDRAKQNARHALAHARIKNSAGGVGKLVQFTKPTVHSIALPTLPVHDPDAPKVQGEIHALEASRQGKRRGGMLAQLSSHSTGSLLSPTGGLSMVPPPPKKKLDHIKISQYIGKIMDAEDGAVTQWEKDIATRQQHHHTDKISKKKRKEKRGPAKKHTMVSIERRLSTTIKHFFALRGELDEAEEEIRMPTAKDLLPSYTLADVRSFLDTFQRVDVDMSGTLDVNEWVEFLSGENNKNISKHQARTLFSNVDMSSQGQIRCLVVDISFFLLKTYLICVISA